MPTFTGDNNDNTLDLSGSVNPTVINTIYGLGNDDLIYGGGGFGPTFLVDDLIFGGNGDDFLAPNYGDDTIYGGAGDDTLDGSIQYTPGNPAADGQPIVATANTDGTPMVQTYYGGSGNDSIFGHEGDDTIFGGDGNDNISSNFARLSPTPGGDLIYGGLGDDTITTLGSDGVTDSSVGDTVYGGAGNDSILGSIESANDAQDNDFLFGGDGNDTIDGNAGTDSIDAGAGDDTVLARDGLDSTDGGAGVDTINFAGDSGAVVFDMASGASTITGTAGVESNVNYENAIGTSGSDTITGSDADNSIAGGGGVDTLSGGLGNDTLNSGAGDDILIGGEDPGDTDTDVIDYSGETNGVTVRYTGDEAGTAQGTSTGVDTFSEIERIVFTSSGDAVNAVNDTVGVTLDTGAGDDFVEAGSGNDSLDGGADSDTLSYADTGSPVTIDIGAGTVTGASTGDDTFQNFESFTLTDGADSATGSSGNDTIDGLAGNDTVAGGAGADSLDGGADFDTLDYSDSASPVEVDLGAQTATGGDATGDTIANFEGVIGTSGGDTLTGGTSDDSIFAGAGNDSTFGGGGDDFINVGGGVDSADGGAGNDSIVALGGGDSLSGGIGDDSIAAGTGGDTLYGGDGDDFLDGGDNSLAGQPSGEDTIYGGIGNDSILGRDGRDTIDGGAGNDSIDAGEGNDTIVGGIGDIVEGGGTGPGASPTDNDTLDMGTQGQFDVPVGGSWVIVPDPGGDPDDGTVEIYDGPNGTGNLVGTIAFTEIENIVCFTRDTMILTPEGEKPIQVLSEGDLVVTRDNGVQPIRWMGSRMMPAQGKLAPVVIAEGALGNDRELRVSQLHRMLITDWRAELMFGEPEVLAAAKHLVNGDTIYVEDGGEVEYFHMLFDRHEIVTANGAPSESFHPGEQGMGWLEGEIREEIFTIFPELRGDFESYGPSARTSLRAFEARALRR